jgi:hypothetical protein
MFEGTQEANAVISMKTESQWEDNRLQKTDIKQTGTKERKQPRKQKEINSGKAGI